MLKALVTVTCQPWAVLGVMDEVRHIPQLQFEA